MRGEVCWEVVPRVLFLSWAPGDQYIVKAANKSIRLAMLPQPFRSHGTLVEPRKTAAHQPPWRHRPWAMRQAGLEPLGGLALLQTRVSSKDDNAIAMARPVFLCGKHLWSWATLRLWRLDFCFGVLLYEHLLRISWLVYKPPPTSPGLDRSSNNYIYITLDDGWPESVEEQGLLLLVWRHNFTHNIWKMCYRQSRRGVARQNSEKCKTIVCIANTFTHRRFYTQKLLHTEAFTHRSFYTETITHKAFTHRSFYIQMLLHTDVFTHRRFYTDTVTHRHVYTQTLLHTDLFTHRSCFYTQTLWHTEAFTHRRFYTQALLRTNTFTHKHFYTQTLLHADACAHRSFYTQTLLRRNTFTHRRFYTQTALHTSAFTHNHLYTQTLLHRGRPM